MRVHRSVAALTVLLLVAVRASAQSFTPPESVVALPAQPVALVIATTRPVAAVITVDSRIRILSLPDGHELREIAIPPGPGDVFSLSSDGRLAVYGDHNGRVQVWATDSGAATCDLKLRHYPGVGVFSHDGKTLALAAQGDALQLVDVATCTTRASLPQTIGGVMAAAFSRDDRYIVCGGGDTAVRVYDTADGRLVSENRESLMSPLAVDFARDGHTVVASGGDKVTLIIDAATGRVTRRLTGATQPPLAVQFSPDGARLGIVFMKSEDMTRPDHIVVIDAASGAREVDWVPPVMPIGGGWSHDGHLIVGTMQQNALHLWTLK